MVHGSLYSFTCTTVLWSIVVYNLYLYSGVMVHGSLKRNAFIINKHHSINILMRLIIGNLISRLVGLYICITCILCMVSFISDVILFWNIHVIIYFWKMIARFILG